MGFLDKFRKKKEENKNSDTSSMKGQDTSQPSTTARRVKKYTSEGKPIYE